MERAWWQGTAAELLTADSGAVRDRLTGWLQFPLEPAQRDAWAWTIEHLKSVGAAIPDAHMFLEFSIPRMGRRADAVIVVGGIVFVVEYKVGLRDFPRHAIEQVHGYALDLKSFHATSHDKRLVPILVATHAPAQAIELGFATDGVAAPVRLSGDDLLPAIRQTIAASGGPGFDPIAWAEGAYRPTPTIIEAAQAMFRGHAVAEISRSEAGAENLTATADVISAVIQEAHLKHRKALCFVTGVPGAGKTLAGLNIVCGRMGGDSGEDATFLSGNGPLVAVLREALKRDLRRRAGAPAPGDPEAKHVAGRSPDKFVQNVHHFRDEYAGNQAPPSEHVVVFDEAQRAWNQAETARFMREKRGLTDFAQSEPEFLLSVMDRHPDWCVVICLVGEGQEINRGEAGIGAWVAALAQSRLKDWLVYAPPQLIGSASSLSADLRWLLEKRVRRLDAALHLATSIRSFRSEIVSAYVAALLADDSKRAREILPDPGRFPIVRTRSLVEARAWLRGQRRAGERAGLVASSNAIRLKPEGLHVKAKIDVPAWFLNEGDDIRASNALEDAATEFDVQGLELDWVGIAWDLNLLRGPSGWVPRRFRGTTWEAVNEPDKQAYVLNSYRVLLTRARQGMVIFVPPGDQQDPTRPPNSYDAIDAWLADCGIPSIQQLGTR
ncbi:MAG: DUF2075 domain-containing protein [Sphingomonadaceae bacterium]